MLCTLKVKPDDSVLAWAIFVDGRPVTGFNRDMEVYLNFAPGVHRLTYDVRGPGSTVEILIQQEPRIVEPKDGEWPFEVKVPGDRTAEYDALYFEVEA